MRFLIWLIFIMPISSYAENSDLAFDIKREIQRLQQTYKHVKNYPIVIFDRDEINWRFLQSKTLDPKQSKQRSEIVKQYIEETVGLQLTDEEVDSLTERLYNGTQAALSTPVLDHSNVFESRYKMCAVFPASFNSNQRLENERLTGLHTQEAYPGRHYEQLQYKMSYKELALFSLYHELSHCLDETFAPQLQINYDDAHTAHQSESFAEVMALFLMAQDGYSDVSEKRRVLRTLFSRHMGQYMKDNAIGFDPNVKKAGPVYYLEPVLRLGTETINKHKGAFSKISLPELMSQAKSIVDQHALAARVFAAIDLFFGSGAEAALNNYKKMAFDWPDLFYDTYEKLLGYINYTDYVLSIAFSSAENVSQPSETLSDIDIEQLCDLSLHNDKPGFMILLETYRSSLKTTSVSVEAMKERSQKLNNIFLLLSEQCPQNFMVH